MPTVLKFFALFITNISLNIFIIYTKKQQRRCNIITTPLLFSLLYNDSVVLFNIYNVFLTFHEFIIYLSQLIVNNYFLYFSCQYIANVLARISYISNILFNCFCVHLSFLHIRGIMSHIFSIYEKNPPITVSSVQYISRLYFFEFQAITILSS